MHYFYLSIAFTLNAAANIILKIGSQNGFQLEDKNIFSLIANNYLFILGVFLFGINVIFYFLALKTIPLSTAYPAMTIMSFLIINGAAFFYLHEKINSIQIIGYIAIVVGLILVFRFAEPA